MLDAAEIDAMFRHARSYQPTAVVSARRLSAPMSWLSDSGARLQAQPGDWELTDGASCWTITADAFARSYRPQPDGRYAKKEIVQAVRLDEPVEVATAEGPSTGRPGDWLVRDPVGAVWPVPDDTFRKRYRPADPSRRM